MDYSENAKGSCLCGAVKFTVRKISHSIGACHCGMCRKWAGGPWLGVDCGSDVSFGGAENISVFNSSDWAERGFCKKCGSNLFYRVKKTNHHFMPVGLFDETGSLMLDHQIFIDKKPHYFDFSNKTENMTEAEVFAKFGSAPDSNTE
jgi:hypothetical protein